MNTVDTSFIKILESQKSIRAIFVVLNVFAWIADDNLESNLNGNDANSKRTSKRIYIIIIVISFIINVYYLYLNNAQLKDNNKNSRNKQSINLRSSALILVIVSLIIFFYLEATEPTEQIKDSIIN